MSLFDPAAATAAYLASVSPAIHARATAYTQSGHWALLGGWVVSIIAAVLILKSGVLNRVSARVQAGKPRPNLAAFACALTFILSDWVLELPAAWFFDWKRNTDFGLTHQPAVQWLVESAIGAGITALFGGLFIVALYALIRRTPKRWWIFGSGLAAIFVVLSMLIGPIFIEPIFNTYTPAPNGAVRDAVVALAKATGTPSDKIFIYNGSRQSDRYTANVSGLFGSARVALSDTMFRKGADIAEIRAVVGHEIGHYQHAHALWGTAFIVVLSGGIFFVISRAFSGLSMLVGSPAPISDPVGLPVLMMLIVTSALIATPLQSAVTRAVESDADAYGLDHAREPDGFARAMMKTVDYRAATPSAVEEFLFYDHPSIQHRIRAAMDWKAAHPAAATQP